MSTRIEHERVLLSHQYCWPHRFRYTCTKTLKTKYAPTHTHTQTFEYTHSKVESCEMLLSRSVFTATVFLLTNKHFRISLSLSFLHKHTHKHSYALGFSRDQKNLYIFSLGCYYYRSLLVCVCVFCVFMMIFVNN